MRRLVYTPIHDECDEYDMFTDGATAMHGFNEDNNDVVDVTDDVRKVRCDHDENLQTETEFASRPY